MTGRYERQEKSQKKHPISSSSTPRNGTTPGGTITQRPVWKGPSFSKPSDRRKGSVTTSRAAAAASKPKATSSLESAQNNQEALLPMELQQLLLNIFKDSFELANDLDRLKPVLQDVKGRLFERDFEGAFEGQERLEAYAVRWSPGRALCYAAVLGEVWELLGFGGGDTPDEDSSEGEQELKVVAFGGGAAEVVAFGGLLRFLHPDLCGKPISGTSEDLTPALEDLSISGAQLPRIDLHLIDSAAWSPITETLTKNLCSPPILSKYASASAKAAGHGLLVPNALHTTYRQQDILSMKAKELRELCRGTQRTGEAVPVLITLLFTLNELYSTSISKTTAFLLEMTEAVAKGSILLVVDSPGSYSEAGVGPGQEKSATEQEDEEEDTAKEEGQAVGASKRKYPMVWLLEHVLLGGLEGRGTGKGKGKGRGKGKDDSEYSDDDQLDIDALRWEKVMGDESRWFRLEEKLRYPVNLENMRFQIHVFRRL